MHVMSYIGIQACSARFCRFTDSFQQLERRFDSTRLILASVNTISVIDTGENRSNSANFIMRGRKDTFYVKTAMI